MERLEVIIRLIEPVEAEERQLTEAIQEAARQLAVDLWRLFTGQTTAEKLGLIYLPHAA